MAELGPLIVPARNSAQAEYVVRSRAEQRGVPLKALDVVPASDGVWAVTVTVPDSARTLAAQLDEDTQVFRLSSLTGRPGRTG